MVLFFLTSPGIYYLISFIIIVSLLVYWKREPIKQELGRWRPKEIGAGPVKLERKEDVGDKERNETTSSSKLGVRFGPDANFSGAKITGVAGRDIVRGTETSSRGRSTTPGVDFSGGDFQEAELTDIAGRDIVDAENSSKQEPPDTEEKK